jgi:CBS domain-containing protein
MGVLGDRFMEAFNDIELHFRSALGAERRVGFAELARTYAVKKKLPSAQLDTLLIFASLRNAIIHNRYYEGKPIAEPVPEIVKEIEQLRGQIMSPPEVLTVLEAMDVCLVRPDDPISAVLEHVRRFDYSQLPIYDDARYIGILTTNAIVRWLAQQLTEDRELSDAPVRHVLGFSERTDRGVLVNRAITAAEAIYALSHGGWGGAPANALIVTENGRETDEPLRVVVTYDLPILTAALRLD